MVSPKTSRYAYEARYSMVSKTLVTGIAILWGIGSHARAQVLVPVSPVSSVTHCGADPTGQADSTAAFAACFRAVPDGDIWVPAGTYKIAGTIVKSRNQNLIGVGSKASILLCQSTTAPCLVVADTTGGVNNYADSRVQDLTIQGPGTNNTSIGVFLGGDPAGRISSSNAFADSASFVNVRILAFNRGIQWGNNAWLNKLTRTLVFSNAVGLYVPAGLTNSGENMGLTDSQIFNNTEYGLADNGDFEWMLSGTSLDYNGTAVEFLGSTIHAVNCHFEQNGGQVFFQPYGYANLSIKDSEILVQAGSGLDTYVLSTWPQYLNISIDNLSVWSNHPIQYFMRVQGTVTGTITNLYGNGNRMIGALSNTPSQTVLTGNSIH
jgi:Pectate lyase superfamily protein